MSTTLQFDVIAYACFLINLVTFSNKINLESSFELHYSMKTPPPPPTHTHTKKRKKKRKVIQRNEVANSNYVAPWVLMIFRSCMKISIWHCYLLLSWRTSCHKNVLLRQNLKTRNAAQNNRVGVEFPLIILGYMTWHGKSHNSSNLILYKFGVIAWHGA